VTFADSVLHLVRAGARIDSWGRPEEALPSAAEALQSEAPASVPSEAVVREAARSDASGAPSLTDDQARLMAIELANDASAPASQEIDQYQQAWATLRQGRSRVRRSGHARGPGRVPVLAGPAVAGISAGRILQRPDPPDRGPTGRQGGHRHHEGHRHKWLNHGPCRAASLATNVSS